MKWQNFLLEILKKSLQSFVSNVRYEFENKETCRHLAKCVDVLLENTESVKVSYIFPYGEEVKSVRSITKIDVPEKCLNINF